MPAATSPLRLIATEEAFATPKWTEAISQLGRSLWADLDMDLYRRISRHWGPGPVAPHPGAQWAARLGKSLLDVDDGRLSTMDACEIHMHVLSLMSPGVQLFDADTAVAIAADANDRMAEAIARHPDRFAGLASFAPHAPDRGVKEIRRAIEDLRLNGLIVNSHTQGEYLDEEKFWPIFEAAEALGAPIYIHPRNPPEAMRPALTSTVSLTGALCGFQLETSLHAMRLIVGGVFDRFPKLTVVLGHLGEGLPFWLYRMDWAYGLVKGGSPRPLKRRPSEYLRDNFVITTSGMNHAPVLQYCVSVLGAERIMFAVDYPFQDSKESADFIRSAPLTAEDAGAIFHRTAERVFRIPPR